MQAYTIISFYLYESNKKIARRALFLENWWILSSGFDDFHIAYRGVFRTLVFK